MGSQREGKATIWMPTAVLRLQYNYVVQKILCKNDMSLSVFMEISSIVQFHQCVVIVLPFLMYSSTVISLNWTPNFLEKLSAVAATQCSEI